jgi:hypothetical protein
VSNQNGESSNNDRWTDSLKEKLREPQKNRPLEIDTSLKDLHKREFGRL